MGLLLGGISQSYSQKAYNRVVKFANNKYLNTDSLEMRKNVYLFFMHVLPFILHGLTWKGLAFSVLPIYFISIFFMISSQINHLTPYSTE
jgi:hypothetical protein